VKPRSTAAKKIPTATRIAVETMAPKASIKGLAITKAV
jgi:hypothetical protein